MVIRKEALELLADPFTMGETGLKFLDKRPCKIPGSLLLVCDRGNADLGIDILQYTISPGSAVMLLPGSILSLHRTSSDFRSRYFYMSEAVFKEATFKLESDFFRFMKNNPVIRLDGDGSDFVEKWISLVGHIIDRDQHRFREPMVSNMLQCLFCEYNDKMKRFFENISTKTNRQEELFHEFMRLVKKYCREYRQVEYYADRLFITPRYLSFICKQSANNLPPKKIIDLQAILEIKIMLETTNEPVQKIADMMNFPDQSYFGRFFKRYTGQSPLSYRLHRKEGSPSA
ncbi:MAG: helix-turn-helix transcriptional regulator [Rikenellaceae bacterium]|nr:helix-turn-helix transcriptional regulator [Rikenellaceae bacterium]